MATAKKKHETIQEALAAFQADLPDIRMDASNPHFKSKFASLANITKVALPKLSEQGLSFSMGSFVNEHGILVLDAHLMHESGTSRNMQIPTTESNPQKLGSFLSYMRRYSLAALTGLVADEDDDGNAASQEAPKAVQKAQERKANPPQGQRNVSSTQQKIVAEFIETGNVKKEQVTAVKDRIAGETSKKGEDLMKAVYDALSKGEVG